MLTSRKCTVKSDQVQLGVFTRPVFRQEMTKVDVFTCPLMSATKNDQVRLGVLLQEMLTVLCWQECINKHFSSLEHLDVAQFSEVFVLVMICSLF